MPGNTESEFGNPDLHSFLLSQCMTQLYQITHRGAYVKSLILLFYHCHIQKFSKEGVIQSFQTLLRHASTCLVKQFIVPTQNQHGKDDIFESELLAAVAYRDSSPAEWSPCNAGRHGPRVHGTVRSQV